MRWFIHLFSLLLLNMDLFVLAENTSCRSREFQCEKSKECIRLQWKCDGESDCKDDTDEQNCLLPVSCLEEQFQCKKGECILSEWKCDGEDDCSNGSDEINCPLNVCTALEFKCTKTQECISKVWKCDGDLDCDDSSDEQNCTSENSSKCMDGNFVCQHGFPNCINHTWVCDGDKDCLDGSDERNCKSHSDLQYLNDIYDECIINNGNCSHHCTNVLNSYKCSCPAGYRLDETGKICVDIDECLKETTFCDHLCHNVNGSYQCECYEGFFMVDGRCKSITLIKERETSLIFSDKVKIRQINLGRGKFMTVLADHLKHVSGIALNVKKRTLFWTDLLDESIKRKSLDENSQVVNFNVLFSTDTVRTPVSLAVDWINDHLYWTDFSLSKISVSYCNGSWPTTIVTISDMAPRSIAVHPEESYMFVSLFGRGKSAIARFWMNGEQRKDIITTNIGIASGVTIDYAENRLFWLDVKLSLLSSADFDGNARAAVLEDRSYLNNPHGIAVFSDNVYWTNLQKNTGTLRTCNKHRCSQVETIDAQLRSPMDIQIDHPIAQPNLISHCFQHTCKYLCLPIPQSEGYNKRYTCACPNGFVIGHHSSANCEQVVPYVSTTNRSATVFNKFAESTVVEATQPSSNSSDIFAISKLPMDLFIIIGATLAVISSACVVFHCSRRRSCCLNKNYFLYRRKARVNFKEDFFERSIYLSRRGSRISLPDMEHEWELVESNSTSQLVYLPMRISKETQDVSIL